jgi:pimeloyl-ACP methyl ester carboxylesterase
MLVIHGSNDQTVPISVAGPKAATLLSNARFIEYSGHAHGLTTSASERLNQDLLAFINGA